MLFGLKTSFYQYQTPIPANVSDEINKSIDYLMSFNDEEMKSSRGFFRLSVIPPKVEKIGREGIDNSTQELDSVLVASHA
jgi:hypothetical protein